MTAPATLWISAVIVAAGATASFDASLGELADLTLRPRASWSAPAWRAPRPAAIWPPPSSPSRWHGRSVHRQPRVRALNVPAASASWRPPCCWRASGHGLADLPFVVGLPVVAGVRADEAGRRSLELLGALASPGGAAAGRGARWPSRWSRHWRPAGRRHRSWPRAQDTRRSSSSSATTSSRAGFLLARPAGAVGAAGSAARGALPDTARAAWRPGAGGGRAAHRARSVAVLFGPSSAQATSFLGDRRPLSAAASRTPRTPGADSPSLAVATLCARFDPGALRWDARQSRRRARGLGCSR
jgi:hypothetical protein